MLINKDFKRIIMSGSEKCHEVNPKEGKTDKSVCMCVCVYVNGSGVTILARIVRGPTSLKT